MQNFYTGIHKEKEFYWGLMVFGGGGKEKKNLWMSLWENKMEFLFIMQWCLCKLVKMSLKPVVVRNANSSHIELPWMCGKNDYCIIGFNSGHIGWVGFIN